MSNSNNPRKFVCLRTHIGVRVCFSESWICLFEEARWRACVFPRVMNDLRVRVLYTQGSYADERAHSNSRTLQHAHTHTHTHSHGNAMRMHVVLLRMY